MDAFNSQQRFDWLMPQQFGLPIRSHDPSPMAAALGRSTTKKRRDDFRADGSTNGLLCCESAPTIEGSIERKRDRDWFRIDLTAGQQYVFELKGIDPITTQLNLRNSAGGIEASSANSAFSADSLISFTAGKSGTYFLDAGSSNRRQRGSYQLNAYETDAITGQQTASVINGYGEIDARAALAQVWGRAIPDQPDWGGNNWWLDRLGAQELWAQGITGRGITVAVVDTGIDWHHVDLDANIWSNSDEIAGNGIDDDGNGYIDDIRGWDFVQFDNDPSDANGHGTHVAGLIAAENNGFGITGAAPDARLMPIRVLDAEGSGTLSDVVRGIDYAVNNGASVINLSLGASFGTTELFQAVRRACERNVMVVMAAGNESADQPLYPAAYAMRFGLAVGANTNIGSLAWFSNRSGSVPLDYVTAAGVDLLSTLPGGGLGSGSGTSMAAPVTSGAAALLRQAAPGLTRAELEQLLCTTARGAIV